MQHFTFLNEVKNMILQNPTTLRGCNSQVSYMHLLITNNDGDHPRQSPREASYVKWW